MVNSYIPKTYSEALQLLFDNQLTIMAGGTDLMVKNRKWSGLAPEFRGGVLFVSQLSELNFIRKEEGAVHIGSTVTLEKLLYDDQIPYILKKAISLMASPGIRNTATLAGNIGNASPAGDTLPVLYILNAKVVIESINEETIIPIEEFILGPGSKKLKSSEMIKEIIIDDIEFSYLMYEKAGGRKSDAISKVSFAGAFLSDKGIVQDIRMAFGAVGPTVVRDREFENKFSGVPAWDVSDLSAYIKDNYEPIIKPINDQRSTADYRKKCAMNILGKFLTECENSYRQGEYCDW